MESDVTLSGDKVTQSRQGKTMKGGHVTLRGGKGNVGKVKLRGGKVIL